MTDVPPPSPVPRSRSARHRLTEVDTATPPPGLAPDAGSAPRPAGIEDGASEVFVADDAIPTQRVLGRRIRASVRAVDLVEGPVESGSPAAPTTPTARGPAMDARTAGAPSRGAVEAAAETGPLTIVVREADGELPRPRPTPSPVAPWPPAPSTPFPQAASPRPVTTGPISSSRRTSAAAVTERAGAPTRPARAPKTPRPSRQPPGGDAALRRLGRGALDLVTGAAAARELVDLAATAQLPVTTGRRIAVVGPRGGAGRTSVAALLACVYAARRADHILAVDVDPGIGSLAWRLGITAEPDPATVGPRLLAARAGTLADVEAVLPATAAGLRVLPRGAALPVELTRALSRFFAISVLDGGRPPTADAHAAILVTPRTPDGVRSTCAALDAWSGGPPVVALVARDRTGHDPDPALRRCGVPVVELPYDRHLAAGGVIRPDRTRAATRREATRLAGLALTAAIGSSR